MSWISYNPRINPQDDSRLMALKVFDLQCDSGHVFEGWFASRDDYDRQQQQGLLTCPVCHSASVQRRLSAARLNLGKGDRAVAASGGGAQTPAAASGQADADPAQWQAALLRQLRDAVRASEDVGDRFSDEARRMHSGEIDTRAIRGTATPRQREELADEGISVLPVPDFLDDGQLQ